MKKRKPNKKIAQSLYDPEINISGGRKAVIISEKDPAGVVHTHAIVKTKIYLMYEKGTITHEMLTASHRFNIHFDRAGNNKKCSFSLIPSSGNIQPNEMTDSQLDAYIKLSSALDSLGGLGSQAGSCIWHVCGLQESLSHWRKERSWTGKHITANASSTILQTALDILARHYGFIDRR